MKSIKKLNKYEAESLIKQCQDRIKIIEKEEEKKVIQKKKKLPLKKKLEDLEKGDSIFSIEPYPITDEFPDGYRVLKCYVSGFDIVKKDESRDKHISISISHDEYPAGIYGMYVPEFAFKMPCYLFGHMGFRFYTLDIKNWKRDLVDTYSDFVARKRNRLEEEIINNLKVRDEFIYNYDLISKLLKEQKDK